MMMTMIVMIMKTGLTTSWTCWRHLCIKLYPNYSCLSDLRFLRKKLSLDGVEVCDLKKRQNRRIADPEHPNEKRTALC